MTVPLALGAPGPRKGLNFGTGSWRRVPETTLHTRAGAHSCPAEAPSGRPCPSPGHMGAAGSAGGTDAAGSPVLRPRGPAATAAPCPASGSTLPQGLSFHSRSSGHPPAGAGVHPRPRKGPPAAGSPPLWPPPRVTQAHTGPRPPPRRTRPTAWAPRPRGEPGPPCASSQPGPAGGCRAPGQTMGMTSGRGPGPGGSCARLQAPVRVAWAGPRCLSTSRPPHLAGRGTQIRPCPCAQDCRRPACGAPRDPDRGL